MSKTLKYFWERIISGDRKRHAQRGVRPATDFTGPLGFPIHAPFAGRVSYQWFSDAGWRVRIKGVTWTCEVSHLLSDANNNPKGNRKGFNPKGRRKTGLVLWRSVVGYMGLTGSTTGVHAHAVIYRNRDGQRFSFAEWLIMQKGIAGVPVNMREAVRVGTVIPR